MSNCRLVALLMAELVVQVAAAAPTVALALVKEQGGDVAHYGRGDWRCTGSSPVAHTRAVDPIGKSLVLLGLGVDGVVCASACQIDAAGLGRQRRTWGRCYHRRQPGARSPRGCIPRAGVREAANCWNGLDMTWGPSGTRLRRVCQAFLAM